MLNGDDLQARILPFPEGVEASRSRFLSHSAAAGFLHGVRHRHNLRVVTGTHVLRLDVAGRRVLGVTYHRGGHVHTAAAAVETLLSAGAVNSPHLLQLSGIGPAERLQDLGIHPVHDLPGVGKSLQDHYATRVAHRVVSGGSLNERAHGARLLWEITAWLARGTGVLSFSPAYVGAFLRSRPELDASDLQFVFSPASYSEGVTGKLQTYPGMTVGVWQMRPHSRGWVRAQSADPAVPPAIQPNYLAEAADRQAAVDGLRWARKLMASAALAPFRGEETTPGPVVQSDAESTVYHAIGTCRMGIGQGAVVGPDLRLRGIAGLRVVDASVMPAMVSANTNSQR